MKKHIEEAIKRNQESLEETEKALETATDYEEIQRLQSFHDSYLHAITELQGVLDEAEAEEEE